MAQAKFGFSEHQEIISKLCRICGERLKKAKDKYENSFNCTDKKDLIFSAFGVKVDQDDREAFPQKICHKCYKLASRNGTRFAINTWPSHKRTGKCKICDDYREQQKPGRRKKSKPGVKPKIESDSYKGVKVAELIEGMSATLSFDPDDYKNDSFLFSEQVKNLESFRGSETLHPEHFAEKIKHEFVCPICKEVLDQPVQTKCQIPHIFCAACLSFSIDMCGPNCPVCRTEISNPKESVAPVHILQKIIAELDFRCPACTKIMQLNNTLAIRMIAAALSHYLQFLYQFLHQLMNQCDCQNLHLY